MESNEIIVSDFCEAMAKLERPVKHAAHQVKNPSNTQVWEWQLAGTYIIADSHKTIALACDGLRLARFTAGPISGAPKRYFLPHCHRRSSENEVYYSQFHQIWAAWNIVQNGVIYSKKDLIGICKYLESKGVTLKIFELDVSIKHILDFCHATQGELITCLEVVSQSGVAQTRLKLVAGPLEELVVPINPF